MGLTHDELREVLARAEEIQTATQEGEEASVELEAVIAAAEEVGTLAFARSADGKHYAAEVLSISPDEARVRYLRGSDHVVTLDQLRPCTLIPGQRLVCNWPMWGPWTCTVVTYDATKRRVKLSDGWGYTRTFPLAEVWLAPPRKPEGAGALITALLR